MGDHILILGAGGFVGSRLVQALASQGEPVIAVGRHAFDSAHGQIEIIVSSGRNVQDYLPLLRRCRAVVHVASASTPGSSAQPLLELEENLRPILALLQALQEFSATPLIYVSSGGSLYAQQPRDKADESAQVLPRSYHGAGKIAAEHFIATWCSQFRASATILRPSNLYGPGQTERKGFGIIPAAFGKIQRNETLQVWGDGSAQRDYLYIDDFIQLCVAALDRTQTNGFRVVNACSGVSVSLNKLFAIIEQVTGKPLSRNYNDSRTVDVPRVHMQAIRARELYGWTAGISLQQGLANAWQWFSTTAH